jgi:hypothetical protein
VLTLCIVEFASKISRLFTMKFVNENMYSQARGKVSSFSKSLLHEFLGLTPAMILMLFFSILLNELPPNYSIFRYRVKVGKVHWKH